MSATFETDTIDLSPREQQAFDVVVDHYRRNGVTPTVRQLGTALGVSSSSTAHWLLSQLKRKGRLKPHPYRPRTLIVVGMAQPGRKEMEQVRNAVSLGWSKAALLEYIDSILAGAEM